MDSLDARRLVPLAWDADVALFRARLPRRGCRLKTCHYCPRFAHVAEDAALAYDLAVSIGRRWSAPSWLEEVAFAW